MVKSKMEEVRASNCVSRKLLHLALRVVDCHIVVRVNFTGICERPGTK